MTSNSYRSKYVWEKIGFLFLSLHVVFSGVEVSMSYCWEIPFLPQQSGCWKESTQTSASLSFHPRICAFCCCCCSSLLENYLLGFIFKCSLGKLELKHPQDLSFQKGRSPSTETTFVKVLSVLLCCCYRVFWGLPETLESLLPPSRGALGCLCSAG